MGVERVHDAAEIVDGLEVDDAVGDRDARDGRIARAGEAPQLGGAVALQSDDLARVRGGIEAICEDHAVGHGTIGKETDGGHREGGHLTLTDHDAGRRVEDVKTAALLTSSDDLSPAGQRVDLWRVPKVRVGMEGRGISRPVRNVVGKELTLP